VSKGVLREIRLGVTVSSTGVSGLPRSLFASILWQWINLPWLSSLSSFLDVAFGKGFDKNRISKTFEQHWTLSPVLVSKCCRIAGFAGAEETFQTGQC